MFEVHTFRTFTAALLDNGPFIDQEGVSAQREEQDAIPQLWGE
jgi:hypothetical protein